MNNTTNEMRNGNKKESEKHGNDLRKYLDAGKTMGRTLEQQITARPYVALGVVGATGFFLGSVIGSRIGQLAVAIGIGFAATKLLEGSDIDVKQVAKKVSDAI